MNTKRINWIDTYKGIGVILVVLGHSSITSNLRSYIFSFHMPLFFFISGYLLQIDRYTNLKTFIINKFRTLLIPYMFFSIISIISYNIILHGQISIRETFLAIIISKRNFIFYNVPLWFLTSLFLIEVMYFLIKRYIKNNYLILLLLFSLSSFVIFKFNTLNNPRYPWSFDSSLYYMFFFGIGNIIPYIISRINNIFKYIVLTLCFIINLSLLLSPQKLSFFYSLSSRFVLFAHIWIILSSLSGIVVFTYIAKIVCTSKMLKYFGENSMCIFALHVPLGLNFINQICNILKLQIPQYNIIGFIETIIILLMLKPIIYIINIYFPFILGKLKLNK